MKKRKSLSKKTRFEVFKRDAFICQYCGATPPRVILHVDHIFPVALGGKNDQDNLITSCSDCNLGKSDKSLSSVPESLKDKAKRIQEREEQVLAYYETMEEARSRIESDIFKIGKTLDERYSNSLPKEWHKAIKMFLEKLDYYEVQDAMEIASTKYGSWNGRFKYFCGICWNKIRDLQNG